MLVIHTVEYRNRSFQYKSIQIVLQNVDGGSKGRRAPITTHETISAIEAALHYGSKSASVISRSSTTKYAVAIYTPKISPSVLTVARIGDKGLVLTLPRRYPASAYTSDSPVKVPDTGSSLPTLIWKQREPIYGI